MDPRTQERVEEWDSRPFNGGFDGLSDLAHADFSGAVSAAGTWLCMLNGRVVGVIDGDIDDFETASGTCYEAPDPSLPLLCTMEEQGGETRAKYYTNETPLQEVDDTLQSGSFTGYVELSENVLSGDYYVVYYGGRRMAAAYIGNAERLLTGEEAFERAADEVGIYEVTDVEIDVVDVPGTADSASETDSRTESATPDATTDTGASDASTDDVSESDPTMGSSSLEPIDISSTETVDAAHAAGTDSTEDAGNDESSLPSETELTDDPTGITATDNSEAEPEPPSAGITESPSVSDAEPASASETTAVDDSSQTATQDAETEAEPVDAESEAALASADEASTVDADGATDPELAEIEAAAEELDRSGISWVDDDDEPATGSASDDPVAESETTTTDDGLEEEFEREEEWRETRRIPSIDPDSSDSGTDSSTGGRELRMDQPSTASDTNTDASSSAVQSPTQSSERAASSASTSGSRADRSRTQAGSQTQGAAAVTDAHSDRVATLTEKVETLQEQRDSLATKAEELEAERDRLRAENDDLSATVDRLQSRIDDLETELEQAQTQDTGGAAAAVSAGTQLSPQQALSQTNLFVRYASKSQPTLETAHDGNADRSEVASNLRLEHHTGFDSNDAAVDGQPYDDFLETTMEYRFVDWLTEMLLYEIRDTGNADGLGDLYDAIPRIDRAELGATISLADDDTDDVPEQVTFDIVAFDKMGNPLLLVTLNDSREPATKDLLADLEEAASAVKANYPDLAAAIAVTSSYFEPGALEVAEQATSSGFLSRSSKLSYVNLSRKSGYHLCLVESRSEGFHMNVPEL